jgi:hypothetical protein
MRARRLGLAWIGALLLALAGPAAAQAVEGEVVDAETSQPVVGASVVLLDAAGEPLAQTVTDRAGRYRLPARAAGEHRVRVERVGHPSVTSEALPLAAGVVTRRAFRLGVAAVSLEGVAVRAEARCGVRPDGDSATAGVWEEARKALAAANAARADGALRYTVRTYLRRTQATGQVHELRETPAEVAGRPFVPAPLERLLRFGFVEQAGTRLVYRAPDAETLLAPEFLDQHCFGVAGAHPQQPGWVGLSFAPVPGRSVPDVEGVLWLDRRTAELRRADFTYTRLPATHRNLGAGGSLEFQRLAGGEWIISRWSIRMPHLPRGTASRRLSRDRVVVEEQGGEVVAVATGDGRTVAVHAPATLRGTLRDAGGAPLPGVRVTLAGTVYGATTGADGGFVLEGVMPGSYAPALQAERLALAETGAVELRAGATAEVALTAAGVPAAAVVTLAPLAVEGRSVGLAALGFYARRAEGRGVHLTAAELPKVGTLLEVLSGIRGLRVMEYVPTAGGATFPPEPRLVSRFAGVPGDVRGNEERPCLIPVMLDGRLVLTDEALPQRRLDQTWIAEVAAVEVYRRRAEVPERFRGRHTTCGLVVLWTREHEAATAAAAPPAD